MKLTERDIARFWSLVDKNGPIPLHAPNLGPCWVWIGGKLPAGYGRLSIKNKNYLAHRIAFLIQFGPIPEGIFVLHHCDNPSCQRHIYAGTAQQNAQDCSQRRRRPPQTWGAPKGEEHGNSKLKEAHVLAIISASSETPIKNIAALFGVSENTIWAIRQNRCWKHIKRNKALPRQRPAGELHWWHKLKENQALEIITQFGKKSNKAIAASFGINKSTVSAIRRNKIWRHIKREKFPPPPPPAGELNARHKLTESQVLSIRHEAANGLTKTELARKYNVSLAAIYLIIHRKTWRHLP